MTIRVIPRLDIKGPNLVKGVHLEGLRVLGKPERFAARYYEEGADELLYMDVVASLYGRSSILDFVRRTAERTFIPLTVGGGIRTMEDIREVLRAGADKVAINTAALSDPQFIRMAAGRFGSSTIVVSIEAIAQREGRYEAFTENGREATGRDAVVWAAQAADLGAGEIMVTSVDKEGTGRGFDLELIRQIAALVPVPVIAGGGAGSAEHVVEVVRSAGVEAVAAASIFHYGTVATTSASEEYTDEGNTEYLRRQGQPTRIQPSSIPAVKEALMAKGFECRPAVRPMT